MDRRLSEGCSEAAATSVLVKPLFLVPVGLSKSHNRIMCQFLEQITGSHSLAHCSDPVPREDTQCFLSVQVLKNEGFLRLMTHVVFEIGPSWAEDWAGPHSRTLLESQEQHQCSQLISHQKAPHEISVVSVLLHI